MFPPGSINLEAEQMDSCSTIGKDKIHLFLLYAHCILIERKWFQPLNEYQIGQISGRIFRKPRFPLPV